jgi:5-methylcytosine-specific restriction endonuclease McrA
LQARTKGGSHWSPNLALACPYCNQRKSNRELPDFLASGDWKLARPADLPERTRDIGRGELGCAQSASTVSA